MSQGWSSERFKLKTKKVRSLNHREKNGLLRYVRPLINTNIWFLSGFCNVCGIVNFVELALSAGEKAGVVRLDKDRATPSLEPWAAWVWGPVVVQQKPPLWPAGWEACCHQAQPVAPAEGDFLDHLPEIKRLSNTVMSAWQFSLFLTVLSSDLGGDASLGGPYWVTEMKDTEKGDTQAVSPW